MSTTRASPSYVRRNTPTPFKYNPLSSIPETNRPSGFVRSSPERYVYGMNQPSLDPSRIQRTLEATKRRLHERTLQDDETYISPAKPAVEEYRFFDINEFLVIQPQQVMGDIPPQPFIHYTFDHLEKEGKNNHEVHVHYFEFLVTMMFALKWVFDLLDPYESPRLTQSFNIAIDTPNTVETIIIAQMFQISQNKSSKGITYELKEDSDLKNKTLLERFGFINIHLSANIRR